LNTEKWLRTFLKDHIPKKIEIRGENLGALSFGLKVSENFTVEKHEFYLCWIVQKAHIHVPGEN
jgi:hypothetical protein